MVNRHSVPSYLTPLLPNTVNFFPISKCPPFLLPLSSGFHNTAHIENLSKKKQKHSKLPKYHSIYWLMRELKWKMTHRGFSWGVTVIISGWYSICRVKASHFPPFFHLSPWLCFSGKLSPSLITGLHSQHSPVAPGPWERKSGEHTLICTATHFFIVITDRSFHKDVNEYRKLTYIRRRLRMFLSGYIFYVRLRFCSLS